MALGIEFANVVGRVAEMERAITGELDEFAGARHNYIEDSHLFRVGFMSTREALDLVGELPDGTAALVTSGGPVPDWLRRGEIDGMQAVWHAGHEPGPVVPPLQGVLLHGPSRLRDVVVRDAATTVRRTQPPDGDGGGDSDGHERFEVVRHDGLVDLEVLDVPDGTRTSVFRATRRPERNRCCGPDIALLQWLDATLRAAGAHG
ncbi:hypothetical protein [Actinomadura sp. WMMB 499]|uniref:hypothetical protein n=1 Tax=Actinomadura sp. WMMB 499 TaxID=1219491 RepID=UPI001243FBD5|nr:hypothetical protein [Actinomadura sp. WMMB 499]QFG22390.1 hypothetical protein F7P10_15905 [Actinomadura sp. WMMB 499]